MSYMSTKVGPKDTIYNPINKDKYMGKSKPVCRSSWETAVCRWLDYNKSVIQWKSEPFGIFYLDPHLKDHKGLPKKRRYYPDYIAKIRDRYGKTTVWLIEVKPKKECKPPRKGKSKSKSTQLYENRTWQVNQAKWKAAQAYCDRRNWRFKILTEDELGIKK